MTREDPTVYEVEQGMGIEEDYAGVETNITTRWEEDTPHHPESVRLMKAISEIDFHLCSDSFCWKTGGDGDNGEALMYELDIIFEKRDHDGLDPSKLIAEAKRSKDFSQQWFVVRFEALHAWAKKHGHDEVFSIMANGTSSIHDPPMFAQQLNTALHRATAAEKELAKLRTELKAKSR